jgi:hypothetical protein
VEGPNFGFSGPLTSAKRVQTQEDPEGTWELSGLTDDLILGEKLAYPTPAVADVTAQTDEQDVRTGLASSIILGYVEANIGSLAPEERQIPNLVLGADPAAGSTLTGKARFDNLGELLTRLASVDGLGFSLRQSGSDLEFFVYVPEDRSAYVRMDIQNNFLTKSEYTYTAPEATRVIVGGAGDGVSRSFAEVTTTDSEDAETAWGRRIELFKDSRSENTSLALHQAGTEELADKGKTLEAVSVSPSDDVTMAFGTDWNLGDKIAVVVGENSIVQIVTEVAFSVSEDGIRIGATVGLPAVADEESTVAETQGDQGTRISNLERNTASGGGGATNGLPANGTAGQILTKVSSTDYDVAWAENYAEWTSILKHEVKAGQGLTKGEAVYVSSADGTNIIVSKASNASESTSSKTMGLIGSDLALNGHGFVITEGLLDGVNTSTATAGDPIWLGTNGGLIFGLANKPVAPAHLVFIGIVTKAANNGEVFIRVQNGFELDELHNVLLSSPADNNLLAYDSASSLWKNQTATEAGVAPIASPSFTGTVSAAGALAAQSLRASFASASARNTAITSPVEGMLCYLQDVNQITCYLGSAWYPVAGQMPLFDVLKTANQSGIVSSSITTITWPTALINRGGFTVASNQVTVPLAGLYTINAAITWDSGNTAGNNRHVLVYVNGAAVTRDGGFPGQTVDASVRSVIKINLAAGDVIDVRGYQTSGSNMSVISTRSRLTISYEGP